MRIKLHNIHVLQKHIIERICSHFSPQQEADLRNHRRPFSNQLRVHECIVAFDLLSEEINQSFYGIKAVDVNLFPNCYVSPSNPCGLFFHLVLRHKPASLLIHRILPSDVSSACPAARRHAISCSESAGKEENGLLLHARRRRK